MSMFNPTDSVGNLAKNLAIQAVMKSTSRFIKNEPVPAGNYEPQNPAPKIQRYGSSNRKLNQKKVLPTQSIHSQPQQVVSFTTEDTHQQQEISNKTVTIKNGSKIMEKIQAKIEGRQNVTPKPKRSIGIKEQQKKESVQLSPKPSVGSRLGSEVSSKGSGLFDFMQTPQPGRYGANRRLQSQKTQQIISKYQNQPIKLTTEIQPPKNQIYQTPAPNSRYNKNQKQSSNLNSPITILNKMAQNNQTADRVQVTNTNTQSRRVQSNTIGRSNVRSQVKDKQQTTPLKQSKADQVQPQQPKKIRSNLIIFSLKRIYKSKILQNFCKIKQNYQSIKQKENKLIKLFIQKLNKIQTHANLQIYQFVINKMAKNLNKKNVVSHAHQDHNKITENCHRFLPNLLNRKYISKVSQLFSRFKLLRSKKVSQVQCKLSNVCQSLYRKRVYQSFFQIKAYSNNKSLSKNINFNNILLISKRYRLKALQNAFRRLLSVPKTIDENASMIKQSPIQILNKDQSSLQASPQKNGIDEKIIKIIQQKVEQNTKKLKQIKQQTKRTQKQLKFTVQNLKNSCRQLSQVNEQREKLRQQLKQKAQSLQIVEQDYIQNSDLLIESRFTFLYEVYIKLQKLGVEEVKISDFYHVYPSLQQEIRSDPLVSQWMVLQHNTQLKRQVAKYQGESECQRKAAKVTNHECNLLIDMIKGYIKQKYTWEWVKNALINLTISS